MKAERIAGYPPRAEIASIIFGVRARATFLALEVYNQKLSRCC